MWLSLFLLTAACTGARADVILTRSVYAVPSWQEAQRTTRAGLYATPEEYAEAAADPRFRLEKIHYASDGLRVVAYVYGPAPTGADLRPVIVFNRGSYTRGDVAPELLTMFRRLALEGFTIVAPMYRGSDGGEGRDEMGGADLNDLLGVPAVLSQLRGVDTGNVFLYGESRGGMMVLQALREGFPARAAATFGAFTDLAEIVAGAQGQKMAAAIWPDFEERADQVVRRRSALRWADSLRVPLLLMQGAADGEVPPTHSLRLAAKLLESRSDVGVILFPGADHIIGRDREERDRQAVRFFRMHIQH